MKTRSRIATIAAASSAVMLILAPQAQANWTSSISNAGAGFESRRWTDSNWTQVQFTGCYNSDVTPIGDGVGVQVWQDLSFQPDDSYDNKIFTACYSGGNTSSGEWSEIPQESGQFYFQITSVGGRTSYSSSVDVDKVYVDTAKP